MSTKNTISDLLSRLVVDVNNMNGFLHSLEKILESKSENVSISQTLDDGTLTNINVPSFGYLKGKVDSVETKFNTLVSNNDDVIGIKSANGDVRKFELKKVSKLIKELEEIKNTNLSVPTSFGVRNNWFFESFLNPLLFVAIDVSSVLTDDINQFDVKRIIINSVDDDELQYFDDNYKGENNIKLSSLLRDLNDRGLDHFEDDNTVDMETAINRYKGSFDVTRIYDEEIDQTLTTGEVVTVSRRKYKLSTLNYTDVLDGALNTRILAEGDVLITANDSEYRVSSVNRTGVEVILERVFGIEPITAGADVLRVKPVPYRESELKINVGYNERQVIFIKPISRNNNITIDDYSNGFGSFSNELTITLEDSSESTLEEYYNNFVSDFGLILLNSAKERKVPSIIGETPSSPTISVDDFKVVQIDAHIKEDEDEGEIQNQIAEKENIKVKIQENIKEIDKIKSRLNDSQKTSSEKNRLQKKLKTAINLKSTFTTQLSSTIKNITSKLSTTPSFNRTPKYRVRGFWPIPEAKTSKYGPQEIAQFKVRYRYLSKKGTAPNAEQSKVTDGDESSSAVFSPWNEYLTKPRTKTLNETTGLYEWSAEDISNVEEVNSNQLDIAIRKGETVEIQIKSVSEAGWPDNPVISSWSNTVTVSFPEDIQSAEEASIISQQTFAEEARIDFEEELTARGLDLHLQNQFTTGERFFAHKSEDVASGFFTNEGNIVNLFEKLKTIENSLTSLQQAISLEKGVIKVSMIDPDGNTSEVKNGDTLNVFAGFYRDQIKDTSTGSIVYNEGSIITKQYIVSIQNTSATPLQLAAALIGGIGEVATPSDPSTNPTIDYHVNRRYDKTSISVNDAVAGTIGSFTNIPGYQSAQVKSQYINSRYKDYGLSNSLYSALPTAAAASTLAYDYQGNLIGGDTAPYQAGHYLPYDPTWDGTPTYPTFATDPKVWNGTTDSTSAEAPIGGGFISEFCIDINHPRLSKDFPTPLGGGYTISGSTDLKDLFEPEFTETGGIIDSSALQENLTFSHSLFFETSVNEKAGVFGNNYNVQLDRIPATSVSSNLNSNRTAGNYPIKLGFSPDDAFLIGKYTCGSYLYMFPNSYSAISVEGNHPSLSTKNVEVGSENAINIPVLFQYRCSDTLGKVGGFRIGEELTNIKYAKKIGIDINVKDESPFSFDIEVTAQYKKETTLDAPVVPSKGNVSTNF
jgi:hypothetical protein